MDEVAIDKKEVSYNRHTEDSELCFFLFVLLILTKLRFKGFSEILIPRNLLEPVTVTFRLSADGPKLNMTPRRPQKRRKS